MIIRLDLVLALPLLVGATAPCTAKAQPVQKPLPEAAVQAAKETVKNGLGTQEQKDWLDATDIRQGNLGGEIAHWDGSEIWVDPDMVHSMVPPGLYGSAYEEAVAATLVPVIKHEIYHAPAGDSGLTVEALEGRMGSAYRRVIT